MGTACLLSRNFQRQGVETHETPKASFFLVDHFLPVVQSITLTTSMTENTCERGEKEKEVKPTPISGTNVPAFLANCNSPKEPLKVKDRTDFFFFFVVVRRNRKHGKT